MEIVKNCNKEFKKHGESQWLMRGAVKKVFVKRDM
jgi:hypothetical protein